MARKKEFNPEKALDKAIQIFWLKGYVSTSMDDLCAAMNIKRGSLYDTFGDKRSLFLSSLDRYVQNMYASLAYVTELDSPLKAIEDMFHFVIDETINDPNHRGCFLVNVITELAAYDEEIAKIGVRECENFEKFFYDLLVRAEKAGEISINQDLHAKAQFLVSSFYGLRVTGKINQDRVKLERIVNTTLSAVI